MNGAEVSNSRMKEKGWGHPIHSDRLVNGNELEYNKIIRTDIS